MLAMSTEYGASLGSVSQARLINQVQRAQDIVDNAVVHFIKATKPHRNEDWRSQGSKMRLRRKVFREFLVEEYRNGQPRMNWKKSEPTVKTIFHYRHFEIRVAGEALKISQADERRLAGDKDLAV